MFLMISLVCALAFVMAAVLGSAVDAFDDGGDGPFGWLVSVQSLLLFGTGFGATGAIASGTGVQELMEASPAAIDAIGKAFAAALTPVAGAIGQGLGNIDELRVVDLGGGANNGALLKGLASMPVETIAGMLEKAKAAGFGDVINAVVSRVGLDGKKE